MIVKDKMKIKQSSQPFFRKAQSKHQINNTPIRIRENKQNSVINVPIQISSKLRQTANNNESLQSSPYTSQSNSNRTIPRRKSSNYARSCANHSDIQGEFKIEIDGQVWLYCNKCAAHLASNGFQVQRIGSSKSPIRQKQSIRSPYGVNKRKNELNGFLSSLKTLSNSFKERQSTIKKAQLSHNIEKQTINNFYASMFQYMQYLKDQHLRYLEQESQKQQQIAQIQIAQIQQTLQEINIMTEDIQNNVQKIVQEVQEGSYNQCMSYYSQKKDLHQHRLIQLGTDVRPACCTTDECVQDKLHEFKNFMDDLTGMLGSKADSNY